MPLKDRIWRAFSNFVSWGMGAIPHLTVWSAEKAFFLAPSMLRGWVDRYTSERILACVLSGQIPMLPNLDGGDAILFYPLPQCERYELLEYPEIKVTALFDGHILAFVIPPDQQLAQYHVCGYDLHGTCYDAGHLHSRGQSDATKLSEGIQVNQNRITWRVRSKRYLTSFIMIHTNGQPHAAGYTQRTYWQYPETKHLPHVVIPPDPINLHDEKTSIMILIVDTDAWVPEILVWNTK